MVRQGPDKHEPKHGEERRRSVEVPYSSEVWLRVTVQKSGLGLQFRSLA